MRAAPCGVPARYPDNPLALPTDELLSGANQADRLTAAAAAVARGIEKTRIEAQAVRVVAKAARSRPIETAGTDIVDRSPNAVAGSREEDRSCIL